ncbi:MAG TPA: hypothetical protein VG538_10800 [Vicinamibacterales bacterium]|nr:hypothetical protein [Vicinamibacterales bacterium]
MRAIMKNALTVNVGGNMPEKLDVAAKLKASGFFTGFAKPPGQLPDPVGMMRDSFERLVINTKAEAMVDFARDHASLNSAEASVSYQTLMEVMSNTHHHANRSAEAGKLDPDVAPSQPARWFAMVYCEDGVAYFTIADLGVGILNSYPARRFLSKLGIGVGAYGSARLLTDAFTGEVGSSTELPGRGRGLPKMLNDAKTTLPTMRVLTSSTTGEIASLAFRRVPEGFHGTIFRWSAGGRRSES